MALGFVLLGILIGVASSSDKKELSYEDKLEAIDKNSELTDSKKSYMKRILYYNEYLESLLPVVDDDIDYLTYDKRGYNEFEEPENPDYFYIYDYDELSNFWDSDECLSRTHAELWAIKKHLNNTFKDPYTGERFTRCWWDIDSSLRSKADSYLRKYENLYREQKEREERERRREEEDENY